MTDNSQPSFWELVDAPVAPREPNPDTQQERILTFLQNHGSITSLEAMQELRIYRLAARIKDLRDKGWRITTHSEPHARGTHARYTLD